MTTVAWDGRTLAADTRCTSSGLPTKVTKAWRLSDGRLFAGCGSMGEAAAVKAWLDGGSKPDTPKDFSGLLVVNGQQGVELWMIDQGLTMWRIESPSQIAIGSGRDFAIAAMALGKSAREAVELACHFDVFTGYPVIEISLEGGDFVGQTEVQAEERRQAEVLK